MPSELMGDPNPRNIVLNVPSRDYFVSPKEGGERELTPYGAALVATYAQSELTRRQIYDGVGFLDAENLGLAIKDIGNIVGRANGGEGVLGMNVLTPNFVQTMVLAKQLKSMFPELKLVFGGPHATLDPDSILEHVPDGVVVVGDGEEPFVDIISGKELDQIDGLVIKREDKTIKTGRGMPSIMVDLDAVPWLNRELLVNEPFLKGNKKTMTFISSRGCVGNCAFCITPAQYEILSRGGAKKVRFRNMDNVIAEVSECKKKYDIQLAQFIDDDMLPGVKRVNEFLQTWREYDLYGKLEFVCLLRPDQIAGYHEVGLLKELFNAGLKKISLGIETGHDRGRKIVSARSGGIDKKYNPDLQKAAIKACAEVGIETKGFFMVGLPGETRREVETTIAYMHRLGAYGLKTVALFPVKVYPNTALWKTATDMGYSQNSLGHYDAPDIKAFIAGGATIVDASRDGYTQSTQLSEVPPQELNDMCQYHMALFNSL